MSSRTRPLADKRARVAFRCEANNCKFEFISVSKLKDHVLDVHPTLNIACKCGAGVESVEHLRSHRARCPFRFGCSRNRIKKAIMENLANDKLVAEEDDS